VKNLRIGNIATEYCLHVHIDDIYHCYFLFSSFLIAYSFFTVYLANKIYIRWHYWYSRPGEWPIRRCSCVRVCVLFDHLISAILCHSSLLCLLWRFFFVTC